MLYFRDLYSKQQFYKWLQKAEQQLKDSDKVKNSIMSSMLYPDGSLPSEADRKELISMHRDAWRHERDLVQWAEKFLGYLERWQWLPEDNDQIVFLFADNRTERDGYVNEFNFLICQRKLEEGTFPTFDNRVDKQILDSDLDGVWKMNGGFINHGTLDKPDWRSHT